MIRQEISQEIAKNHHDKLMLSKKHHHIVYMYHPKAFDLSIIYQLDVTCSDHPFSIYVYVDLSRMISQIPHVYYINTLTSDIEKTRFDDVKEQNVTTSASYIIDNAINYGVKVLELNDLK